MKIPRKTASLFYKYLISYSVLFILPFLVLGGLVYLIFMNTFQNEVLTNNMNQLEKTRSVIDDRIEQLNTISNQITLTQELRFNHVLDDPLLARSVIANLRSFTVTNKFIDEIFLYVRGDEHILTSTTSLPLDRMNKFLYAYPNWTTSDFMKILNESQFPSVRAAESMIPDGAKTEEKRVVTFIYPLTFNGVSANRTLLMQVPEANFTNLLPNANDNYNHYSFILDAQNHAIASAVADNHVTVADISSYINEDHSVKQTVTLRQKTYILSFVKSSQSAWTYVTLIPQDQVLQKVTSAKLLFLYTATIFLLVGSGIIFALMKINYRPLNQLIKYTQNIPGIRNDTRNELEVVKGAIDYLNTQNRQLSHKLEDHAEAAKNFFIFQLLKGGFRSSEELQQKATLVGYDWAIAKSAYQVAAFHFHHHEFALEEMRSLVAWDEYELPSYIQAFFRNDLEQQKIIVLFMFDTQHVNITTEIEKLKNKMLEKYNGYVTLGLGQICYSPDHIPKSYLEALAAVDYRFVQGVGQTIHYNDIRLVSTDTPAPKLETDKLRNYLKQGHVESIEKFLEEISVKMKSSNMPVTSAKMTCLEIIYCVLETVKELSKTLPIVTSKFPDVYHLSGLETIDELVSTVTWISTELSKLLSEKTQNNKLSLIEQLKNYVQHHFSDPEFSVVLMAAEFSMSQAYLSQYFKEHTGITLTDYETTLKIELAKQLLKTTKLPVKDIALELGYLSVTGFLRRFKQVTGVTPTEFRAM